MDKKTYRAWLESKPGITVWGMAWAMFWRGMILMYGAFALAGLAATLLLLLIAH